jgi:nucleoside 2-deoxyribosyltransferase
MKVYLAGPDVFLPDALDFGRLKVDLCARYGLTGLFPLDNEIAPGGDDASLRIFRANEAMMDGADAVIANLTPFRGPSADAGTVYELGYMAGQRKLCLGYSNDPAPYSVRLARTTNVRKQLDNRLVDDDGLSVENFGQVDNLMIVHALDIHGYPIVTPRNAPADIWHDLTSFETCLRLLAEDRIEDRAKRWIR